MNEKRILGNIIFYTFIYAFVRYVIFGDISYQHIPLFISNKALALSIVLLLPYTVFKKTKLISNAINILFALHLCLSIMVLKPSYYPDLFLSDGSLSLNTETGLLMGFLAIVIAISSYISNIKIKKVHKLISLMSFIALHNLFIGIHNWYKPQDWFGYMPPMTLIAFIMSLYGLFLVYNRYKIKKISPIRRARLKYSKVLQVL